MITSLLNKAGNTSDRVGAQGETSGVFSLTTCHLLDGDRFTSAAREKSVLKALLRGELLRQARIRLPATYANLAERLGLVSMDAIEAVRSLLEKLMDDDAGRGRPLLASVAVSSIKTGLPSSWFFRKAESIGRFSGDATNLEAYAFHAMEFHNATRFYANSRASPNVENYVQHNVSEKGNKMLIAKDIMTPSTVSVRLNSTVAEVADVLVSHGISGVPVIDKGVLRGIVSEGDLLRRMEIGTDLQSRPWWLRLFKGNAILAADYIKSHSVHVTDVMTGEVVTVTETTAVADIIDLLERKRIRRVPVVRDGQVVGIVSRADIVKAILVAGRSSHPTAVNDDSRIRTQILNALRSESWLSEASSSVTVNNGVVTFWGAYMSEEERKASHILAENVSGVHAIDDHRTPMAIPYGMM
jgi:CBS domain-containing protein